MKEKLDELTYLNGSNLRDFVFKFNVTIMLIYIVFGIGEFALNTQSSGKMNVLIGILPFGLVGLIYPAQIYTLNYFQKVRFYMIPVKDVYYYHIKEFYNLKNVLTFVGTILLYDILMSIYANTEMFHYFIEIIGGFSLSPLFVAIGFFIVTIYSKGYKVLRISLYIMSYVIVIPLIVFSILATQAIIVLGILLLIGLLGVYLIGLTMNYRERKIEV